jgi:hypothetical protein
MELSETKAAPLKESYDHDTLRTGVGLVLDNLGMTSEEGTSSLAALVINITDWRAAVIRDRAFPL